jgi:16S rRNA (adenine(1408)-N(1))-methyltransferase
VVIDIGTGDGRFVYEAARRNPRKFYIGVDPNARPLEKISEKIHRNAKKGGLPNVLFVQAAVESLPEELDGIADEVHVHFPWGSLLGAVATGDAAILRNIRRVSNADALLEVVVGVHPERDRAEMDRLGMQPLSMDFIDGVLTPRYRSAGFEIQERAILKAHEWAELDTAWAKRLSSGSGRTVCYIVANAI